MALMPKRTKFRKSMKGQMAGLSKGGNFVHFGEFGIQALERGWLTAQQIEACRVAINRYFQRKGKVWIRIFPDKPVSKKPAEVRMGKGKAPWTTMLPSFDQDASYSKSPTSHAMKHKTPFDAQPLNSASEPVSSNA